MLLYGHLDKQPEMTGWADGFGPWMPRIDGDKLYGRGGADDGYAIFGALSALLALQEQGIPHARCVILIEACEESGSHDLPYYVDHLAARLGNPSLVVCLDSGCGNYDQLWLTTSLRGMIAGTLEVRVLDEGVHSGDASGVVPSSFRIMRQLLSRLEDEATGAVRPSELYAQIPAERMAQARKRRGGIGRHRLHEFPFAPGMMPVADDLTELVLNRTWRPQLAVIGIDGLPSPGDAGNVLLPFTRAQLSLRLPPTLDAEGAGQPVARPTGKEPAVWRAGRIRSRVERHRLERAGIGAVARTIPDARLAGRVRGAARLYGRGRQHPVHGDAGREIPAGAVCRDRRARPAFQRARPERIPAHSDRPARHRRHRASAGRPPCPTRRVVTSAHA